MLALSDESLNIVRNVILPAVEKAKKNGEKYVAVEVELDYVDKNLLVEFLMENTDYRIANGTYGTIGIFWDNPEVQ